MGLVKDSASVGLLAYSRHKAEVRSLEEENQLRPAALATSYELRELLVYEKVLFPSNLTHTML